MKPRVYIETTIPSYLTAWPSRDLLRAAQQQMTREWWDRRAAFDLYISPLVLVECQAGDPAAAADRMAAIAGLPLLDQTESVIGLAEELAKVRTYTSASRRRCSSHCNSRGSRHAVSSDMELYAYRECRSATSH